MRGRLYRHFKGGVYRVLHMATHSETDEEYVVYQGVDSPRVFVRPHAMFVEDVDRAGYRGPRFAESGEDDGAESEAADAKSTREPGVIAGLKGRARVRVGPSRPIWSPK